MTSHADSGGTEAREVLLARAGWLAVSEAILAGLCHDLNNRAASLEGLAQLLEEEAPDMLAHLGSEVERLVESVSDFRALTGDLEAEAEPLMPLDVVKNVDHLHGRRRGHESVTAVIEVADGLPPVLANPTVLARTLLIALDEVTLKSVEADERTVSLSVTGSPDEARFTLQGHGDAARYLREGTRVALTALVSPAGWVLEDGDGAVRLTLPSLSRARALEG